MARIDSVFSPHLAQFESPIPFANDEPYLPRQLIEDSLDELEDKFADSIAQLISNEARKFVKKLEPAIDKGDVKAINKADWSVYLPLQQLMWGLWSEGWELGQNHGFEEIEIALEKQGNFSRHRAEFADKGKFDNRKAPLRKHFLQPIIEARTVWMGDRVSEDTKARIKEDLVKAVLGDENGQKIGKRELYRRVAEILGEGEATTKKSQPLNPGLRDQNRSLPYSKSISRCIPSLQHHRLSSDQFVKLLGEH